MSPEDVVLVKARGVLQRNVPRNVDGSGVECRQFGVTVVEHRVDDLVHVRSSRAPVAVVGPKHQFDSRLPRHELERPGAGAGGGKAVAAGRVDDRDRLEDVRDGQFRKRLDELDQHGRVVHRRDRLDVHREAEHVVARLGIHRALVGGHHRRCVDRPAAVEGGPFTQRHRHRAAVASDVPYRGQARRHVEVRVVAHQRVVHRHDGREVLEVQSERIEVEHILVDADPQGAAGRFLGFFAAGPLGCAVLVGRFRLLRRLGIAGHCGTVGITVLSGAGGSLGVV